MTDNNSHDFGAESLEAQIKELQTKKRETATTASKTQREANIPQVPSGKSAQTSVAIGSVMASAKGLVKPCIFIKDVDGKDYFILVEVMAENGYPTPQQYNQIQGWLSIPALTESGTKASTVFMPISSVVMFVVLPTISDAKAMAKSIRTRQVQEEKDII